MIGAALAALAATAAGVRALYPVVVERRAARRRKLGSLFVAGFVGFGMLQAAPAYAAAPSLSVRDVRITEIDTSTNTAVVRVALSRPAPRRVTAHYTTLNGTAKYGARACEANTARRCVSSRWRA